MQKLPDNLVKIHRNTARGGVFFPLLKDTEAGPLPASHNDLFVLRQIIIARAAAALPGRDIWLRDGKLWSGDLRRWETQIPAAVLEECFKGIECQFEITEDVEVEARGKLTMKQVKRLKNEVVNLEHMSTIIQNKEIKNAICDNARIPEFRFLNEPPTPGCHTPALAWVSEGMAKSARVEMDRWRAWMLAEAPKQWEFFLSMLRAYWSSLRTPDPQRRILVGVGPNASGKGTFCKLLEFINNCSGMASFAHDDLLQEWRTANAFPENCALTVCHEWQLDKPTPSTGVGLVKSASRCESISIRGVGREAKTIRFTGGVVLFANAEGSEGAALAAAHRYFAPWLAFDRFSVVFINWAHRYPGFEVLRLAMNRGGEVADAIGLWLAELAEVESKRPDVGFPIPEAYRDSVAAFSGRSWEAMLEALLHHWVEFDDWFESWNEPGIGGKPTIETQRKHAVALFAGLFGKQKDLLVSEFATEKDGKLVPCFRSSTVLELLRERGANRKWQVPEELKHCIRKGRATTDKSRLLSVVFTPSALDDKDLS